MPRESNEQRLARLEAIREFRTGQADSSGTDVTPAFPRKSSDPSRLVREEVARRARQAGEDGDRNRVGTETGPARTVAATTAAPSPGLQTVPAATTTPAVETEMVAGTPAAPAVEAVAVTPAATTVVNEVAAGAPVAPPMETEAAATPAAVAATGSTLTIPAVPVAVAELTPPPGPTPTTPTAVRGVAGTYRLADTSAGAREVTITNSGGRLVLTGLGEAILLEQDGDTYFGEGATLFGQGGHQIRLQQKGNQLELTGYSEQGQEFTTMLVAL